MEVFYPTADKQSCFLPSLPVDRYGHTMEGLMICGGEDYNCITFTSGQWVTSHLLTTERQYHTSWSTQDGVVLMGGRDYGRERTTEIIKEGEYKGVPGFNLQYDTR